MAPDDLDPPEDPPASSPDDAARDDHDAARSSDLRAKDLIGRSREELEAELDPSTMAELASWFARPSATELRTRELPDEMGGGGAQRQSEADELERMAAMWGASEVDDLAVRERAMAAIEPAMLRLFDRHLAAGDRLLPVRPEPALVLDETIVPASIRSQIPREGEEGSSFEPRILQRSPDIDELLDKDNAPQAVLRDLNRPVEEFERRLELLVPPTTPEEDPKIAIRAALAWRPEPIPPPVPVPNFRADWLPLFAQSWPEIVAVAKAVRKSETDAADAQAQADAEQGILWRF